MPRKQVYGKRSTHVYSNFAGFTSPVKQRKEIQPVEVLEIADEFEKLTVQEVSTAKDDPDLIKVRSPLARRDGNAAGKRARTPRLFSADKAKNGDEIYANVTVTAVKEALESCEPAEENADTPETPRLPESALSVPESIAAQPKSAAATAQSNIYTEYASSLLSLSSRPLERFADWSDELSSHFAITKIAEASFGEVYRLSLLRPHPALDRADESVLKIIALKSPPSTRKKMSKAARKRLEMMSDPEDVASEVRLMQRMTSIPGYTMFRECCLLQGRPGESFVSAWRNWNEVQKGKGKETSVFPDPGKKASYNDNQLWAVVEMQGKPYAYDGMYAPQT